ncbi:MAG: DNA repair exonuclease, partial [Chloroflexi bacterium]|nr:DNA repair exonuclease [Chloroflexota bacterium]
LLHTAVAGADGHEPYAPCSVDDLVRCEYDYFALGHVHQRREIGNESAKVGFSGNLQGRHARETGPKGALVVDLEPGVPARARFAECDVARWEALTPDISRCRTIEDVSARMREAYDKALGTAADLPLVVRFQLAGPTPAASELIRESERLDGEARSMIREGGAYEKVKIDVSLPTSAPSLDPELRAMIGVAADGLAGDSERVKEILKELKGKGVWRRLHGSECDLEEPAVLRRLVDRAAKELTAGSRGED